MLQVEDLHVEIGPRVLLERASFTVDPSDKIGLVGANGAGKSTLLTVLAGAPAASVAHTGAVRNVGSISYLPQMRFVAAAERSMSAESYVMSGRELDVASVRVAETLARVQAQPSMANIRRFSDAEDSFRAMGGYEAESQVRKICAGLGLTEDRLDRPLATLSGGERRRVELARTLFAASETLLLDEPSNHLDLDARAWLMSFLRGYQGALVIVSHDLHLLDTAITRVLHLEAGELHSYRGTYSGYLVAREADIERRRRRAGLQRAEIDRLARLADSMRHSTEKRARKAKTLDRRVERLQAEADDAPGRDRRVAFKLPPPPHSGELVLRATTLRKSFDHPLFEDMSFEVRRGDRVVVIGLNGAGKTTLLKILAGRLEADAGDVRLGTGVRLGYYAQEHEDQTAGVAAIDHLRNAAGLNDQDLRAMLGAFTLRGDVVFQDVATLSGGEKTKLALAALVAGANTTLLLDEPTNNLDPPSRQAIGTALAGWEGTLVLVSHDEEFVRQLDPTHALMMPEGDFGPWSDDLIDVIPLA